MSGREKGTRHHPFGCCAPSMLSDFATSAATELRGELGDLVVDRAALGMSSLILLVGVHDRGVVPVAELLRRSSAATGR
jgi:hypothetical protein